MSVDKARLKELALSATKPIPGYEGYEADTEGNIWSVSSNWRGYGPRILKTHLNSSGYPSVKVKRSGKGVHVPVHRLVCLAFHGPPLVGQQVRHLDGNCLNSCPDNLAWGTAKENAADRARHGTTAMDERNGAVIYRDRISPAIKKRFAEDPSLVVRGERSYHAKLTDEKVLRIRELAKSQTCTSIAKVYGLSLSCICRVVNRETWTHV